MNLIVEKSPEIRWYTNLSPFVSRARHRVEQYTWLVTDLEINGDWPFHEVRAGACWLGGQELARYVSEVHPQFIWAVLSAIRAGREQVAKGEDVCPYADGNPNFWKGSPRPQHPFADFEIVCWDSSATLLIGGDEELSDYFKDAYPGTLDLDAENGKRE